MKILFDSPVPFMLAHGGQQIQILRTYDALRAAGVEVEFLRWHDENQKGDLLHYFGRVPSVLLELAQSKGLKVVMADLLAAQGARSAAHLWLQSNVNRFIRNTPVRRYLRGFNWEAFRKADACIALTTVEARLAQYLFGAREDRVYLVTNGVEDEFLQSPPRPRGEWLVCTATIVEHKRVLELAQAAILARTPVWVIGRPYSDSSDYARRFIELARGHPNLVRYEGPIQNRQQMAQVYREARGFILISAFEALSLSALEAAACECPLLLSDLPWAQASFAGKAMLCPVTPRTAVTAQVLRRFYDACPELPIPPRPASWMEVAEELKRIYTKVLKTSL